MNRINSLNNNHKSIARTDPTEHHISYLGKIKDFLKSIFQYLISIPKAVQKKLLISLKTISSEEPQTTPIQKTQPLSQLDLQTKLDLQTSYCPLFSAFEWYRAKESFLDSSLLADKSIETLKNDILSAADTLIQNSSPEKLRYAISRTEAARTEADRNKTADKNKTVVYSLVLRKLEEALLKKESSSLTKSSEGLVDFPTRPNQPKTPALPQTHDTSRASPKNISIAPAKKSEKVKPVELNDIVNELHKFIASQVIASQEKNEDFSSKADDFFNQLENKNLTIPKLHDLLIFYQYELIKAASGKEGNKLYEHFQEVLDIVKKTDSKIGTYAKINNAFSLAKGELIKLENLIKENKSTIPNSSIKEIINSIHDETNKTNLHLTVIDRLNDLKLSTTTNPTANPTINNEEILKKAEPLLTALKNYEQALSITGQKIEIKRLKKTIPAYSPLESIESLINIEEEIKGLRINIKEEIKGLRSAKEE